MLATNWFDNPHRPTATWTSSALATPTRRCGLTSAQSCDRRRRLNQRRHRQHFPRFLRAAPLMTRSSANNDKLFSRRIRTGRLSRGCCSRISRLFSCRTLNALEVDAVSIARSRASFSRLLWLAPLGGSGKMKPVNDTEKGKSLCDAGALVGTPAYATIRSGSLYGADATPSIRIAQISCKAEADVPTDGLDHGRWYHAKVDGTAPGRIHSVPRDGIDPRVAFRRRPRSASRGVGPHPGKTGGAAMVCAAARGAEASEGGRFASDLITVEAIT